MREWSTISSLNRAPMALRIRVNSSAIGSVCDIFAFSLPACLDDAREMAAMRQFAQAQTAHLEAPIVRPRAPAQRASIVGAHLELGGARRLDLEALLRHRLRLGGCRRLAFSLRLS